MKIDEYAPIADPDEHREREVLQRLAAEQQQRQDREQHDERRVHRPHHRLVQRQVDVPSYPSRATSAATPCSP